MNVDIDTASTRLPVVLLTGFLGAGKSTLLNFVLRHPQMTGTAVVINEYGSVGIDHHLVESASDDMELIADGCLCCTARGQLADALMSLFKRAQQRQFTLKRVIVETTGLAEPGSILQQFLKHPQLAERFVVDTVVTLVDALNAPATLDTHDIAVQQITGADVLLVTKTDLVASDDAQALEQRLATMNPDAVIERVRSGAAQPSQLFAGLHRRASSGAGLGALFADADRIRFTPMKTPLGRLIAPAAATRTPADQEIQTFSLIFDEPLPAGSFYSWLDFVRTLCGPTLLRMKGLVNLKGQDVPTVIHGVQKTFHPVQQLPSWPSDDQRTRIVFITRGWGQDVVASTMDWLRARLPQAQAAGNDA
ncbi:CobW family GTP-binding protein [Panacagrimonas sp.]|uniref:CobW family GTP-binding protein n=1 Tax=Panacagrimonas sp. TaxID=2480088 RepID=UPI003B5291B4